MGKRTRYSEYKDAYEHYKFELTPDGVLLMQGQTNGGPLEWFWESHDSMADAWADIAGDREIKVVLHTGHGRQLQRPLGQARHRVGRTALQRV